ncbi:hypothetical protein WJX73_008542 [Symbiochloris irregularis]|uniref:Cytochrome b5 heme-binding domain-containing protein n=1 Tax=Symbiochloris irregularis TaxID=706552 RepID=A0AAW1NP47_9CHLO
MAVDEQAENGHPPTSSTVQSDGADRRKALPAQPGSSSVVTSASKTHAQSSQITIVLFAVLTGCVAVAAYFIFLHKVVLTAEQLARFDGAQSSQLYLAVLGKVFDVSRSKSMYGPDGTYSVFVGKDASRAFATGNFEEDSSDITDLKETDIKAIYGWLEFYEKAYTNVGVVSGPYYDHGGHATPHLLQLEALKPEQAPAKPAKIPGMEPCGMRWADHQRTN